MKIWRSSGKWRAMEPVIPVYQQNLLYFESEQPGIRGERLSSCEKRKYRRKLRFHHFTASTPFEHVVGVCICKAVFVLREQTRTLIYKCDQAMSNKRSMLLGLPSLAD